MTIHYIKELAYNDKIAGHLFTQPALWYGRQMQAIVAPLETPPATYERVVEMAQRIRQLVLVIVLPLAVASFVLGIAIKYYNFVPPSGPDSKKPHSDSPSTAHPSPLQADDLSEAPLRVLEGKMEAIFADLRSIHAEAGREMEQLIGEFEATWGRNPVTATTSMKMFQHLKSTFSYLKNIKQGLFLIEHPVDDVGVMRVPKDGNCFFHSMARGLIMLEVQLRRALLWREDIPLDHEGFRKAVVDWMRNNYSRDAELLNYMGQAIEAYVAVRRAQHVEERLTMELLKGEGVDVSASEKKMAESVVEHEALLDPVGGLEAYLQKIGTVGFFASTAELYAVSQMFGVAIHVEREIRGRNLGEHDRPVNPGSPYKITLIHKDGNHFDLKVLDAV
jgi:hypothetical protein